MTIVKTTKMYLLFYLEQFFFSFATIFSKSANQIKVNHNFATFCVLLNKSKFWQHKLQWWSIMMMYTFCLLHIKLHEPERYCHLHIDNKGNLRSFWQQAIMKTFAWETICSFWVINYFIELSNKNEKISQTGKIDSLVTKKFRKFYVFD